MIENIIAIAVILFVFTPITWWFYKAGGAYGVIGGVLAFLVTASGIFVNLEPTLCGILMLCGFTLPTVGAYITIKKLSTSNKNMKAVINNFLKDNLEVEK